VDIRANHHSLAKALVQPRPVHVDVQLLLGRPPLYEVALIRRATSLRSHAADRQSDRKLTSFDNLILANHDDITCNSNVLKQTALR
jgi:hypothetical protein